MKTFDESLADLVIPVEINAGRANKAILTNEAIQAIKNLIKEYLPKKLEVHSGDIECKVSWNACRRQFLENLK